MGIRFTMMWAIILQGCGVHQDYEVSCEKNDTHRTEDVILPHQNFLYKKQNCTLSKRPMHMTQYSAIAQYFQREVATHQSIDKSSVAASTSSSSKLTSPSISLAKKRRAICS